MLIEDILPQFIAAKAGLRDRLLEEFALAQISREETDQILSAVPALLLESGCFLDRMTGFWRYEFGIPFTVNDKQSLIWGTHMWVPVAHLCAALLASHRRTNGSKRQEYLARLADPARHQDVLCEMAPIIRVDPSIPADFEVAGLSPGNQTLDWVLGPVSGRKVIFDVKRRVADFIGHANHFAGSNDLASLPPDHDPALLFRSVENKLSPNDPASSLQGVWIATEIKQESSKLATAFDALDQTKVHFAILADWQPDIHVLTRRPEDRQFLLGLFQATESNRFTFDRPSALNLT
jgi:hypothetical protein